MTENNIFNLYQHLYKLPKIERAEEVDLNFFQYYKDIKNFVVIVIYNNKKEFLLIRNFAKNIGWELVGGRFLNSQESIIGAVNRICKQETGLDVNEVTPIALVSNLFRYKNSTIRHDGLAFIAEARGQINLPLGYEGFFTHRAPLLMPFVDSLVLRLAIKKIKTKTISPIEEIEYSKKYQYRKIIHKYFVASVLRKIASTLIKRKIEKYIPCQTSSFLDASCGDDDFIIYLLRKYHFQYCVANDICWENLIFLQKKKKITNSQDILFTNHNIIDLPYIKNFFDVVLCKNTFHHMRNYDEQILLLRSLSRVAKRIILVDIEDPNRSTILAKLFNRYYRYVLGDQGGNFLIYKEFQELIKDFFKNKKIKFDIVNTIKGCYMFAIIDI